MTTAHHHWPSINVADSNIHFATKPPLGGTPISDKPARPKAITVIGKRPSDAAKFSDSVVSECFRDETGRHEHRRLRKGVREQLEPPAGPRNARPQFVPESPAASGNMKKQVADLRNGRISNEQFQARLTQRQHASEQDCPRS